MERSISHSFDFNSRYSREFAYSCYHTAMTENEAARELAHNSLPNDENKKESIGELLLEVVRFSAIALLFIIPIRIFIAQPYIVSGASMDPTFQNGEYLIVDQLSY